MCSICGYFSQEDVPTCIVTDMLQKTEHRGPDAHGLYADGKILRSDEIRALESSEKAKVCRGHSRLSIVGVRYNHFGLVMALYRWCTMGIQLPGIKGATE